MTQAYQVHSVGTSTFANNKRVGDYFVERVFGSGACVSCQDSASQRTTRKHSLWHRAGDYNDLCCKRLLPAIVLGTELKSDICVSVLGKYGISEKSVFVDHGSIFAFPGAVRVGSCNGFNYLDTFGPLRVFQV